MPERMSRRDIMTKVVPAIAAAGTLAISQNAIGADAEPAMSNGLTPALASAFKDGQYVLPPLPYAYDALEPSIDAETMHLHHDKHHKTYVDGLNKTLKSLAEMRAASGEMNVSALCGLEEDLSFNAGGHILHTIFWTSMGPHAGGDPKDAIGDAISKSFGSVEGFKTQFSKAAGAVKGSGWAILAYEPVGDQLIVLQAKQHDLQLAAGMTPLLPLDVWEHAYYLKYRNVRADYVKAWWDVVNWPAVNDTYVSARRMYGRS
jgi:superoxide dismutase, Fe-Mn family